MVSAGPIILSATVLAASVLPAPGEVIVDEVDGLAVVDEQLDLDFAPYQEWAPELVDHLDPASESAAGMRGAYRIWSDDDGRGVIANVTLWPDIDGAARYVDQAARDAAGLGLRADDSPFDGVLAFSGTDEAGDSYTYLTWRDDQYGVAMVAIGDDMGDTLVAVAIEQQTALDVATVRESDADGSGDGSSGGIPIGTVLLWLVAIVVAIVAFVKIRAKLRGRTDRPAGPSDREPGHARSADDIIAEARAEGRRELGLDDPSDAPRDPDDIIAEARGRARDEVEAIDRGDHPDV